MRYLKSKAILSVTGLSLMLVFALAAFPQGNTAGLVGTVKDRTGAVVPAAQVVVTNLETGQNFTANTGADGTYTVPSILHPGNYQVAVTKEGFKSSTTEAFTLQVGDVRTVDVTLELGTVSQQVTVTGAPTALQTQTSDVGAVISGREIVDLPLNGRNFTELATLQPGVSRSYVGVLTDATAFNQGDNRIGGGPGSSNNQGSTEASRFSRSAGASISVNGIRPTQNDFMLDGVDNNEPQFGTIGVFPNPDAVEEFKIDTSVAKAEYGRGGAVVNTIYRSGSNSFHGEAYYFGQNSALNAAHWVLNTQGQKKSVERINEFGGQFGGPIIKNKTFFFVDYLGQRNHFPNPFQTSVPTAKSRQGDFSEFSTPIIDPLTCHTPGDTSSGGCQQFPGNVIPNLAGRPDYSSPGFKLLNAYPLPTVPNVKDPGNGPFNYFGQRNNQEKIDSYDIKVDQQVTAKNRLSGRFTHDNQQRLRDNYFPGLPTAGFGAGQEIGNTRQVAVSDTHIFSPTVLNEARFGWTKVDIGILNCGVEGACGVPADFCTKIGIPNCNKGTPATTGGILIGGFGSGFMEFLGDGGLFEVRSNNYYVNDNLTILHGKHAFKAGGEARPTYLDTIDGGRAGGLKGQLQYCQPCAGDVGNIQADMLLQRPGIVASSGTIVGGDNPLQLRKTEWAMFVEDDWKATPDLTLNLGLRYEIFPGYTEANGRLANYDVAASSIVVAKGSGSSLINTKYSNFGPRVGFAYTFGPEKKFVLRGGYGLFYAEDGVDFPPLGRNPPIISSVNFNNFSGVTNDFNLTTGPPVAPVVNPPVITSGSQLYTVPRNQQVADIQEANLGVQWQMAREYLLDVGYVGSRSRKLATERDLGGSGNGLGAALTPSGAHLNSDLLYDNYASGSYDSLQTSVRKRYAHGLLFLLSYTYSHGIDNSTGIFGAIGETRGSSGGPVDPFNLRLDKGNSSLDHRQLFVASGVWDLPFGHGRAWGANTSNVVDKVLGGWQLNFIQTMGSGQHFDITANSPGSGSTRADAVGAYIPVGISPNNDQYLTKLSFAPPSQSVRNLAGTKIFFGNLARNFFTGPSRYNTDLSVFKTTSITEQVKAQIRFEFFNAWNSVNRLVPDNNINDGSFGQFFSAYAPRTIQYTMKIIF